MPLSLAFPTDPAASADRGQPAELIFFTELDAAGSLAALEQPGTLATLADMGASVALALTELDDTHAYIARMLQGSGVHVVAWLCLSPHDGFALNLANYPRVLERYAEFQAWALEHNLRISAIGLAVEPPDDSEEWTMWRALRGFARGLWLAHDNALYPSAHAAYLELVARMRHDGYQVHAYQLPFVAEDRWVGTTLVQRTLDIIDLPSDVDVLMCDSAVPIGWLSDDLGGALIASYGPSADAIAVGAVDVSAPEEATLTWGGLRRDLLLAAQYTDTIYVASLEHCVRTGALARIAALDWSAPASAALAGRLLITAARTLLLAVLLVGRFGYQTLAWAGWVLALVLWIRARNRRSQASEERLHQ
jgi:hypothetical protein